MTLLRLAKSRLLRSLPFLLLLSLLPSSTEAAEAILLQDVRALTLYRDRMTTGRRTSPIPQLQCMGEACGYFQPSVVQCTNQGFDGRDFQWKCSAEMEDWYRFGAVTVACEGYTNPDDPYILAGSCGLEYELKLTAKGREHHYGSRTKNYEYDYTYDATPSTFGTIFYIIWFGVFAVIIFSCLSSVFGSNRPAPYPTGAPYPTAGVYPDAAAPPPYAPYGPSYAQPSSGGGFWSGAATGGVLGYLFGRNRNYGYNYGYPRTTGWGGPSYPNTTYPSAPRFSSSSSSSSSHTSEGYGGTRRR